MIIKIFILLATIFIIVGCKTPDELLYLKNDNNGQLIKLSQNEEFVISLNANPTAGFTWKISEIDSSIVTQIQEVEFKPTSEKLGSPGDQIFRFRAISLGQTEIKLVYHRPWEKQVAPLDTFFVTAEVKK